MILPVETATAVSANINMGETGSQLLPVETAIAVSLNPTRWQFIPGHLYA